MKAAKELYERRQETKIYFIFLGSTTIQWVKKLFQNTNEMVASPSQGVLGYICPNLVFKALRMC